MHAHAHMHARRSPTDLKAHVDEVHACTCAHACTALADGPEGSRAYVHVRMHRCVSVRRRHLLTYLLTYLLAYLLDAQVRERAEEAPTYLLAYLLTCLLT